MMSQSFHLLAIFFLIIAAIKLFSLFVGYFLISFSHNVSSNEGADYF